MEKRFEEILARALRSRVSDIHFQLNDGCLSIDMRTIGGIVHLPQKEEDVRLFNYLQYLSHLDVSSRSPQTGSFTYFFRGRYYDFRLAVITTLKSRDGVLRILNCHDGLRLDQLTYDSEIHDLFRQIINLRSGLVIFSGLTGSGKTTTMYSLLNMITGRTIYSLEDPIEVYQDNIVQLQISEKAGMDYAAAIKQILRHNPDVLMIGEIRDEKAAVMAVRAALTGVLVFSSLHAANGSGAVRRLLDLGVKENDLAEVIQYIFSQRLCRKRDEKQYTGIYDYLTGCQVRKIIAGERVESRMDERLQAAVKAGIIEESVRG
ncbi:MAG: Flp pilus assembly complex ATPase component TadA [Erysipelotrichaceae bacterium]|nr:Flp pilus assembly complex ATPase component TadA [Erysipelotrichaceae bacterium]